MIKLYHVNVKKLKKLLHEQGKSLHQVTRAMDYHQLDKQLENGRPVTMETLERLALKAGIRNKNEIICKDYFVREPAKKQTTKIEVDKLVEHKVSVNLLLDNKSYETLAHLAAMKDQTLEEYAQDFLSSRAESIRSALRTL